MMSSSSKTPPPSLEKRPEAANIGIRSEVEAPFRALRLVLFGFFAVSASVGALIAVTQVIGALGGARNALPLEDVAQSLVIDLAAAGTFAFFLRRDLQARDKQIARLTREERLGALPLALANGRRVKVGQLRSFSRVVIAAGSPTQVAAAVAAAEPLREQLQERGVLVVPLPIFPGDQTVSGGSENGAESSESSSSSSDSKDNLRWKATPLRLEEWKAWFDEQTALAGANLDKGLYISLRLDGRVRGSGQGPPPWQRLIAQLAPLEGDGAWKGFFDGFDGRV
ncbi:g2188 [Coccomyxa elongata]